MEEVLSCLHSGCRWCVLGKLNFILSDDLGKHSSDTSSMPIAGVDLARRPYSCCSPRMLRLGRSLQKSAFRSWAHHSKAAMGSVATQPRSNTELGTLEDVKMSAPFLDELPRDPETKNGLRQVHSAFSSQVACTPTGTTPTLVAYSPEVAQILGLDPSECERPEFAEIFAGNATLPATRGRTYSQCYGGHQFGSWAGQLGDGRAINFGHVETPGGQQLEVQLKGAGRTPYSRMADGRAVLRSSVREFIASEAMHHLGVPTTRALSLVATGADVPRDQFYNGNAKMEPGAVCSRVSPSFIRFGSFQLPASRGGLEVDMVPLLADYVIRHHYPHLQGQPEQYKELFREVTLRTGHLVAMWQAVGFVHGVLNTDNMSILGETIDYGPFGYLERFDPDYTPNTTDFSNRRYAFRQQPSIGQWNLCRLAESLIAGGLFSKEDAQEVLGEYEPALLNSYNARMARKMGLKHYDKEIAVGLLTLMYEDQTDFINTFRALANAEPHADSDDLPAPLQTAAGFSQLKPERQQKWHEWYQQYQALLRAQGLGDTERRQMQDGANPCYIPRNHLLQKAIEAAEKGDYGPVNRLFNVLKRPYEEQAGCEDLREVAPHVRMGIECLSCSS